MSNANRPPAPMTPPSYYHQQQQPVRPALSPRPPLAQQQQAHPGMPLAPPPAPQARLSPQPYGMPPQQQRSPLQPPQQRPPPPMMMQQQRPPALQPTPPPPNGLVPQMNAMSLHSPQTNHQNAPQQYQQAPQQPMAPIQQQQQPHQQPHQPPPMPAQQPPVPPQQQSMAPIQQQSMAPIHQQSMAPIHQNQQQPMAPIQQTGAPGQQQPMAPAQQQSHPQHAMPPPQPQQQHLPPAPPVIQPMRPPMPQQGNTGRSRRMYAVDPQVAGGDGRGAPWPHGLTPPQQGHPPASRSPTMSSIQATASPSMGANTHQQRQPQQPMPQKQQLPPEMRAPQQPRPRIDPDQMPAPVQVREQDQLAFENQFFGTMERDRVPLATTDYIGLDQGNANPRFMRATTDKIPMTKDLADTSKLPLALVVHPLAKRRSDEVAIQVVDHGEEGPVRCSRCRAYISPWCVFIQGGARFVCSICSHANDVPSWYFSNTDMSGRRVDIEQRPELRYGSVEFEVPKDYHSTRAPAPLSYVFAIDVSAQALQTGMVNAACEAIKFALYASSLDQFKLAPENKIGILTFDKSVHFYNLHASLPQAQMLVVPDIEDMFVPFQDGFLVDSHASRDIILELLDALPTMFQENARRESVFTAAIQGGRQALASTGGFMHVFQSCLPNHGPHALKSRDDKNLYNTEKEKGLMVPQSDAYKELAKECVKDGVCVNAWLFPTQYTDVATLAVIPETTGGDVHYFAGFNYATDASNIHSQLDRDIHRELGYDGILRIRCCDGLQVIDHYGNCNMSTYTDMELAGIDEDKAMAAVLKHDSKLDASRGVSFQCALLYTTKNGLRRVRVHNINLTATSEIAEVFRHGDVDTTISVMLRKAIFDLQHKDRKAVHQALTDQCVNILTAYRVNCASSTSPGQLILPEAFKLLPVYVHGAIRSKALRGVGSDMNADARAAGMRLFNGLGVKELAWTLYPRLFPIHSMEKDCGDVGVNGYMKLPAMLRTSYERLDTNGIYLLDTGSQLFVWLGNKVDSTLLQDMFGVKTLDDVDPKMTTLPALNTDLSHRVHAIIDKLQAQRSRHLQLHVIRMEKDPLEFVYSTWMTEDRNAEVQTYVDYMCVLHRKIQEEMKKLQH